MSDSFPAASGGSGGSFPRGNVSETQETLSSDLLLFGRYRVQRELGRGGMGVVFLAHDTALDIQVAIKMVPDVLAKDTESVADLRKEVLKGMALMHPGIVRTHNFEKDEGGAGIVMEYVEGDNLSDLKSRQPGTCFDPEQILPWIEQLCSALDYAHREARIVHRDLKPRNLMIAKSGKLKIADFGIAAIMTESVSRHSVEGNVSGTLSYMSPQQAEGKRPTHLDDIHAVGATIYELLTGKPPFFRGSPLMIQTQVITMVPPSIQERREELEISGHLPVSEAWEVTIAACLAKDPSDRPQNAMALLKRLTASPSVYQIKSEQSASAHKTGKVAQQPTISRRIAYVAAFILLVCICAAVIYYNGGKRTDSSIKSEETPVAAISEAKDFSSLPTSVESRVAGRVKEFVSAMSGPISDQMGYYSESVDYFGKHLTQLQIRKDLLGDSSRWSNRTYVLQITPSVTVTSPSRAVAEYVMRYSLVGPRSTKRGTLKMRVIFDLSQEPLKITSINSSVIAAE